MSVYARVAVALLAMTSSALRTKRRGNSSSSGYVVSMGDSYTSGCGLYKHQSDYHNGDACARDFTKNQGGQLASNEGLQHLVPACAGDELPQIREQFTTLQAEYPQEAARGWEDSVITLTIGGNDIRSSDGSDWGTILADCIVGFYSNCHTASKNQVANWDAVQAGITEFLTSVAQGASNAVIRMMGYPRLLGRSWHCIGLPSLNFAVCDWMDDMVDMLNSYISAAVSSVKRSFPSVDLEFVSVTNYLTSGACNIPTNHVHAVVLSGLSLSPMAFHPTERGYNAYYDALANSVSGSLGRSLPPSQLQTESSTLWDSEKTRVFQGWDTEQDGQLSISEVLKMAGEDAHPLASKLLRQTFKFADADQDGYLTAKEFEAFLSMIAETE